MEWHQSALSKAEWDKLITQHNGAFQQSWGYGAAFSGQVGRFELRRQGNLVGVAQLLVRHIWGVRLGMIARGPVWLSTGSQLAQQIVPPLTSLVTQENAAQPSGFRIMTPSTSAIWDIDATEERLRENLKQKWRNRLARAESRNISITYDNDVQVPLTGEAMNRMKHRYRGHPFRFLSRLAMHNSRQCLVAKATSGGAIVASALFYTFGSSAIYLIGHSTDLGRKLDAMNVLLWQSALELKRRGIGAIDLGAIDTVRAPGLARFKLGTGARAVRHGSTELVVPLFCASPKISKINPSPQPASMK